MTPEQREELKAAASDATPGQWLHRYDPGNPVGVQHGVKLKGEHGAWIADCLDNADKRSDAIGTAGCRNAHFIALANPAAILSLITQVEALTVPQWQPIETAPEDCILLLATEFFHKGDWRIKVGGYWNGGWDVFGASWTPSHWMPLPAAPTIPAIPGTKEDES